MSPATAHGDFRDDDGQIISGVQGALRKMDERSWREYVQALRDAERRAAGPDVPPRVTRHRRLTRPRDFERDDPGSPLGHGMPTGAPLRKDGESHREAWARVVRRDPCSYCGGPAGTLDHVDPRSGGPQGLGGVHSWTNFAGACGPCNGSKGAEKLLLWLRRRAR